MTHPITCLNGRFIRADRAAVPLADRGFRFGDGVFETIRLHKSVPYQWELHIARLMAGLAALRITPPDIQWSYYAAAMIRKNNTSKGLATQHVCSVSPLAPAPPLRGSQNPPSDFGGGNYPHVDALIVPPTKSLKKRFGSPARGEREPAVRSLHHTETRTEGFLRIAVSRGVGSRGYQPHPPGMPATWAMEYLPPLDAPDEPYRLWLSTLARTPPQCLPTQYKLAQGVNSTLAALEAQENHCDDALQLTLDGCISETTSANIFWIADGKLFTPGLETGCLAGTTRDAVLRLSPASVHVVTAGISRLENAEAVFITNTRLGIFPVASVQPMGWRFNPTHPLIRELQQRLTRDRNAYRWHP